MLKNWLTSATYILTCLSLLIAAFGGWYFHSLNQEEIEPYDAMYIKKNLPSGSFTQSKEAYAAINGPLFSLKYVSPSLQLPDLKKHLIYYGKNGRPDARSDRIRLHFSFNGNKTPAALIPEKKYYLFYDKKTSPPQYGFLNDGQESPLWLTVSDKDKEAVINVYMQDGDGTIIHEPESLATFSILEKEYVRMPNSSWSLGKYHVDGGILARQKAKWHGPDKFLERHGGAEYANVIGKQRIDFGEGEDFYSVYVGMSEALIWKNDRWHVVKPGYDSLEYPLLTIKKIEDRLMGLELWDVEGKGKIILNMLKMQESWAPQNIQQSFKFLGARTRSQFVFEVNKERIFLSPKDWLVLTDKGWKKISTSEEIDAFVERKVQGLLFIFDDVIKKDEKQFIKGVVFNIPRTDMHELEIPISQGKTVADNKDKMKGKGINAKTLQINVKQAETDNSSEKSNSDD
ncbi:hypothetical protein BN1013_00280 [Candidatus Rubidus massiliensis]|nr:hypothetical protein BN1013_00280 [Candidatus Rubidus massiliensis]